MIQREDWTLLVISVACESAAVFSVFWLNLIFTCMLEILKEEV